MSAAPSLTVVGLNAWYGESQALHGMGFEVGRGEIVSLLGRNGAGKTTTLRSIMGLLRNGLNLLSVPSSVQVSSIGVLVIVALLIDAFRGGRR